MRAKKKACECCGQLVPVMELNAPTVEKRVYWFCNACADKYQHWGNIKKLIDVKKG